MKVGNGCGGGGSLAYAVAICLFAIVLGRLALSAHSSSTHQQVKVGHTRGLYVSTSPSNRSSYHTDIICPTDATEDVDERKLTLIFCTVKCYCHGNRDQCYCCQMSSSNPPVCYDKLDDCKANCPSCNPECPHGTAADSFLA
ncbi:unnamed protein product [Urochloa humidicola]